jgi:tetratricopeptide (TPR) repeat protein
MDTKAAVVLAVAVVGAALIIANSKSAPEAPSEQGTMLEGDARVAEGGAGQPSLERAAPEGQMARLEQQLREAREQIKALQDQMEGKSAVSEADLGDRAVLAKTQSRFFALKKAYLAGSASKEELSELVLLSKNKRLMGHIVSGLEQKIADNPDDLDARLQLADVESSRVHIAESITERAMFGKNVREQIKQVLERDPENWRGRFMRAVGISHSQRTPQGRANAIKEFETLLTLQQASTPEPRFAQTYEQLASVYLAEKDTTKARATVQAGLTAYPDAKDLKELLERLSKDDQTQAQEQR